MSRSIKGGSGRGEVGSKGVGGAGSIGSRPFGPVSHKPSSGLGPHTRGVTTAKGYSINSPVPGVALKIPCPKGKDDVALNNVDCEKRR